MRINFVCSLLLALSCLCTYAQNRCEVFTTLTENDIPYRIPALAALPDGTLVCVADYRYSRKDVGMQKDGRIDLRVRVSKDNGNTWGDVSTIVEGKGAASPDFMNVAFGDPCIVADRRSGKILMISCAGNISYPKGTPDCHLRMVRFYSEDGGNTWSSPEDMSESIYALFDNPRSMFITSGRIMQSRYIKVKKYYRLYCAVLQTMSNGEWVNYVIYSDDFGQTWGVLGDSKIPPVTHKSDEAKVEELPDGSVLIGARVRKGGRNYNVFTYTDKKKAEGTWASMVHSGDHNNGIVTVSNHCNGGMMMVPVTRVADGAKRMLLLQSVPKGPNRANVGIYYKVLDADGGPFTPEMIARDWDGFYPVSDKGSAYSTMAWLSNERLGFLMEEETHCTTAGGGYTIVFDSFSVDELTDGAYKYNSKRR